MAIINNEIKMTKIIEFMLTPFIWIYELFHKDSKDERLHKEILRANGHKFDLPRIHRN